MNITDVKSTPIMKNPHNIAAKKLYDTAHAEAIHMTLEPGEHVNPHTTPVDVFFYVLEGNPEIEIGSERQSVSPDQLIDSPAHIPHALYNPTTRTARVLVVKVPKPGSQNCR